MILTSVLVGDSAKAELLLVDFVYQDKQMKQQ